MTSEPKRTAPQKRQQHKQQDSEQAESYYYEPQVNIECEDLQINSETDEDNKPDTRNHEEESVQAQSAVRTNTMSWFDATGFANLAKTALKEAQKTIDKALDITEEDGQAVNKNTLYSPVEGTAERVELKGVPHSESEPQLSTNQKSAQTSSLWGSFSGSFFDNPKTQEQHVERKEPAIRPTDFNTVRTEKSSETKSGSQKAGDATIREEVLSYPPVVYRKKEPRNCNNRLSAISSESDRRSSSSCEVLGSCTPESEPAPSLSSSSSVVRLRQSGSFESLTSPSSVEVICSSSGDRKRSSDSISPLAEGEGGVPELVEDSEASEASETLTSGTVLDLPMHVMHKSTSSLEVSLRDVEAGPAKDASSDCEAAAASSCEEGTLMGSSGEDNTIVASSSSASYLKTLIADAMTEQNVSRREQSPISSESRSDMIKVGSSSHTSGDELETTTSSDIEIISSPTPNGDSGSAASRHSPARSLCRSEGLPVAADAYAHAKPKPRGHRIEMSEVEKLFKRISEMTEMLEEKEAKLVDLGRVNSDLRDSNDYLKGQLETRLNKQDVTQMSEDFTKRLAALECKLQQAIVEKDQLKIQLDKARASVTATEAEAEKDQTIKDLRSEGEKLSKQQLTLNNLIKKLRATEKDNQKVILSQKEKLEECDREVERCKKALAAKQDVERTQIEAVHQLTRANQRLEVEAAELRAHVDGLTSTVVSLQREVAEGVNERTLLESRLNAVRTQAEEDVRRKLEAEWGDRDRLERKAIELEDELTELQDGRQRDMEEWRKEKLALERRLESAVAEAERAAQSSSAVMQPLMRQLDAANTAHAQEQAAWEQRERKLLVNIGQLESTVSGLTESERSEREQVIAANTRCSTLEARLSSSQRDLASSLTQTREANERLARSEQLRRLREEEVERLEAQLNDKLRECLSLERQLAVERVALEAERRKTCALQDAKGSSPAESPPSPTLSLGRLSLADSTVTDDPFETYSASGRLSGLYDGARPCTATSLIEGLQAQLKQREGEVNQLQWEVARRDAERAVLSDKLAHVTAEADDQRRRLADLVDLKTEYDALLLLYGEKLEECQELRMDLCDVKDAYKAQIDQLLCSDKKEPGS